MLFVASGNLRQKWKLATKRHRSIRHRLIPAIILGIIATAPALLLRSAHADIGQWSSIGPEGGSALALVADPVNSNTLYVSTFLSGVFKSTDFGQTWVPAANGLIQTTISSLTAGTSSVVYAATAGGVYKTTDGAANWSKPYTDSTNVPTSLGTIVVDPSNNSNVFVAGNSQVSRSTDGGVTWTASTTGLTGTGAQGLAIDPINHSNLYVGFSQGGVFKSTDGGVTWNSANTGIPATSVNAFAVDATGAGTVYACTNQSVYKTTDGGSHWNPSGTFGSATFLTINPADHNVLISGTNNGPYESTDGGGHWNLVNTGLPPVTVSSAVFSRTDSNTLVIGTTDHGVFKSSDSAGHWTASNTGLTDLIVEALLVDPTSSMTLYAGTNGSGVKKTTDGGATWFNIDNGKPGSPQVTSLVMSTTDHNKLAAAANGVIYLTTDGGATWASKSQGLNGAFCFRAALDPNSATTLYAGSVQGLYKSTDSGATWSPQGVDTLGQPFVQAISTDPVHPNNIYVGTYAAGAYRSTDGGATWIQSKGFPFPSISVYSLVVDATGDVYAATNNKIFKSTDQGNTWNDTSNGIGSAAYTFYQLLIDPSNPTTFYAAGAGVYVSTDSGANWTSMSSGLQGLSSVVYSLAADATQSGLLYAGTPYSVYSYQIDTTAPFIDSATYDGKKTITIHGRNFGQGAKVFVNGTDLSQYIKTNSDTSIKIKAKAKFLGLAAGANTVQVQTSQGKESNVFQLNN